MEIERHGPGIRISWDSGNGVIYELQVSNGLSPINVWEPLLVVEGTGDRISFEHENPFPGTGFYRLDLEKLE